MSSTAKPRGICLRFGLRACFSPWTSTLWYRCDQSTWIYGTAQGLCWNQTRTVNVFKYVL